MSTKRSASPSLEELKKEVKRMNLLIEEKSKMDSTKTPDIPAREWGSESDSESDKDLLGFADENEGK